MRIFNALSCVASVTARNIREVAEVLHPTPAPTPYHNRFPSVEFYNGKYFIACSNQDFSMVYKQVWITEDISGDAVDLSGFCSGMQGVLDELHANTVNCVEGPRSLTYTQDGLEYEIRLRDRERGSAVLHTVRGLDIQPQANIHKFSAELFDTRGKCFKSNANIRSFATFSSANLIPLHPSWAVRAFVDLE